MPLLHISFSLASLIYISLTPGPSKEGDLNHYNGSLFSGLFGSTGIEKHKLKINY